jgi:hypothetical protein
VSGMVTRMGATLEGVQVGGGYAVYAPILVFVPPGISPGGNVLEASSAERTLRLVSMTGGWGGYLGSRPSSLYRALGRA